MKSKILSLLFCLSSITQLDAVEKYYELKIQNMSVNFTGDEVNHALGIAQTSPVPKEASIPAPTLRFNLGDDAVIKVVNETDEPTTLHWHGVLVPWQQDGPQFSNTKIIEPKSSHTFRFPIRHTGTYWYHSHTEFQEQRGLYGAIVIEEERPIEEVDHDYVFIMSDWTNEVPKAVLYNLKKDGHYYALKKNFIQSLWEIIRNKEFKAYNKSEWNRMGAMDLSDVGYDAFLVNGKMKSVLKNVHHGEKIRFRIINAAASSYFYFNIGNKRNFKVITKDGMPVQAVKVNELLIGMGETYDVIFEVPHAMKTFEAKATAQDTTGSACVTFGMGEFEPVPPKSRPSPYKMDHGGMHGGGHGDGHGGDILHDDADDDEHMGHGEMDHAPLGPEPSMRKTKRLNYEMLKSVGPTNFDDGLIRAQTIDLELSGDMHRYTWHINGKPFSEDKYITIRENEVITFRLINKTMMHHPIHLHGHFFRVLNGQGPHAPLFHTVDVPPLKTVTIEFHANEPGIWFLHCHNLYHMKMGMARLVRYEGFEPTPELKEDQARWGSYMTKDDDAFWRAETGLYTNIAEIDVGVNAGRYEIEMELKVDRYEIEDLEADAVFKRYLSRFLALGAGALIDDQKIYAALAAAYQLPGNVKMSAYMRHDGKGIVKLTKSIPLLEIGMRPLVLDLKPKFEYKDRFDWELRSGLNYEYSNRVSFGIYYKKDHDEKGSIGFGIKVRF